MPSFEQLSLFAERQGMPWFVTGIILFIHYRTLSDIARTQAVMANTIEHLASHIFGSNHKHEGKSNDA